MRPKLKILSEDLVTQIIDEAFGCSSIRESASTTKRR